MENHLHALGVTRLTRADHLVVRRIFAAAGRTRSRRDHAADVREDRLHAPETPAGNHRDLLTFGLGDGIVERGPGKNRIGSRRSSRGTYRGEHESSRENPCCAKKVKGPLHDKLPGGWGLRIMYILLLSDALIAGKVTQIRVPSRKSEGRGSNGGIDARGALRARGYLKRAGTARNGGASHCQVRISQAGE